jgi:hypothetical protein
VSSLLFLQFGKVWCAQDKETGQKVAIKSINKRRSDIMTNHGKDIKTEVRATWLGRS